MLHRKDNTCISEQGYLRGMYGDSTEQIKQSSGLCIWGELIQHFRPISSGRLPQDQLGCIDLSSVRHLCRVTLPCGNSSWCIRGLLQTRVLVQCRGRNCKAVGGSSAGEMYWAANEPCMSGQVGQLCGQCAVMRRRLRLSVPAEAALTKRHPMKGDRDWLFRFMYATLST
jgi:hypothetical protein